MGLWISRLEHRQRGIEDSPPNGGIPTENVWDLQPILPKFSAFALVSSFRRFRQSEQATSVHGFTSKSLASSWGPGGDLRGTPLLEPPYAS